jgi:aconitate hydratase
MLVVAYALAGSMNVDLTTEPLGHDKKGSPVYLKDIWPSPQEIASTIRKSVTTASFRARYGNVFDGGREWKKVKVRKGQTYAWDPKSTYVKHPHESWLCSEIPSPPTILVPPARSRRTVRRENIWSSTESPIPISIPMAPGAGMTK